MTFCSQTILYVMTCSSVDTKARSYEEPPEMEDADVEMCWLNQFLLRVKVVMSMMVMVLLRVMSVLLSQMI